MVEKEYKQQVSEGRVSDEIKFSYAWHLIKSGYKNDIRKGIGLMEGERTGKQCHPVQCVCVCVCMCVCVCVCIFTSWQHG